MDTYILPEEIVPDKDFGTVRQPKGIDKLGVNWVAKDLGSSFLVFVDTDTDKTAKVGKIKGAVKLDMLEEANTKASDEETKQKILATINEFTEGKIKA